MLWYSWWQESPIVGKAPEKTQITESVDKVNTYMKKEEQNLKSQQAAKYACMSQTERQEIGWGEKKKSK